MKKTIRLIGLVSLLFAVALGISACSSPTPGTAAPVVLNYKSSISDDVIKSAVISAATKRHWIITSEAPGRVELNYKGYPSTVTWSNGVVSISDSGRHRKTRGWATNLRTTIQSEIVEQTTR
ncbi:hypothetical protein Ga0100231_013970 [Opitutaceae bacterium TAV4]|uniref:hypothetical protein n=1 Tax=Geminisphaera colitermitum TaxID=1148786 RepID=UPI000158CAB6|nr:hypothetical protein [Geminisphaera colitermitum]RRJ95109.1 hypothetical protein Ga0100231_013130 [Opitutaceae bacterium TAV4]RRJ95253.1 hypothetical protein Ga0100231_013970 [Opitutaceae bacterium TAV4]RRJ99369.1 hypothetical protein Ga0100230_014440 [Opitutaceae bacterium TAV3]